MTHYTIVINGPESILKERFPRVQLRDPYNIGQHIAWDGPARKADAVKLYTALAPYSKGISLFRGGGARGSLVMTQGKVA